MGDTCARCVRGEHTACDGIAYIIDQDGHSRYVCECYCRRQVLDAQRQRERLSQVRRLMSDLGIDQTYELVEKS
jgi:hypothetical protein